MFGGGGFNGFISSNNGVGAETLGTVPVLGWVSNSTNACSFQQSSYPNEVNPSGNPPFNSYNGLNCGAGYYAKGYGGCTNSNGCAIYGNDMIAAITSIPEPPPDITASSTPAPGSVSTTWADSTWQGGWVRRHPDQLWLRRQRQGCRHLGPGQRTSPGGARCTATSIPTHSPMTR